LGLLIKFHIRLMGSSSGPCNVPRTQFGARRGEKSWWRQQSAGIRPGRLTFSAKPTNKRVGHLNIISRSSAFRSFQNEVIPPTRTLIPFRDIPSRSKTQNRKNLGLANDIGGDGKTGSKRGFGGFRGTRRLQRTTPTADYVTEREEVAQGNVPWNTDRRRRDRFETVALPHLDAAYALARWLTRNDADAADVVQEACLRAFRYFDTYRDGNAKTWLLQIVRRTCYSWLERNRPTHVVSLEAESEFADVVATASSDAEGVLESRSDLRRLDQLIEALPVSLRETIMLR
jgi:RNA polymerase sigma-70 factor, ECF subfamily